MKTVRIVCRVLIGLLFIFSGYVKAIDPIGSQLIFEADFIAFHLSFLVPLALPFGVMLSLVELVLGCCLLMGVRMKETAWGTLLFMSFMTVFTLVLAIFNPVTDCGCFGEALKLTNWETFFKNIVIMGFVLVIFWQRKNYKPATSCLIEWITVGCIALLALGLSIYSYRHLPLIDFMNYKVGTNVKAAMSYPENAEADVYETFLYYEKEGKIEKFTLQDYPKDSTWTFVETKSVLKKKGYEPPIHDFTIVTHEGENVVDSVLNLPGYVILLVLPHVEKASLRDMAKINDLAAYSLLQDNWHFLALSGSGDEQVEQFALQTGAMYPFYTTDEKPLLSMVRSNPGLVVLNNATIFAKWAHRDIPTPAQLEELINTGKDKIIAQHNTREDFITDILAGILFLSMIIWGLFCRKFSKKNDDTATLPTEKA